jgi:4-aminobutyrate aminotransferase-like enzyme
MHPRGKGLMTAIDLPSNKMRNDVVMEAAKNGLVLLGCGLTGIRCIPPYIVTPKEIDEAMAILSQAIKVCSQRNFTHKGNICTFADCSQTHT